MKNPLKSILKVISSAKAPRRDPEQHRSREETHDYWRNPDDGANAPEDYAATEGPGAGEMREKRSLFLVDLVKRHAEPDAKILEVGCNVGRNLDFLFRAGYKNLESIEISEKALEVMRSTYPEMAAQVRVYNQPVEDVIRDLADDSYGLVFTMAVLEHVHSDSEWVFAEMVRIAKDRLVIIEDEQCESWRHFPRRYDEIFESLGVRQIEKTDMTPDLGLKKGFVARVFEK